MSLTLDPSKPPDTGESPTLGASRIRNISAFLLQLFGESGTVPVTYAVNPISSVDHTTGLMTLPGPGTASTQPIVFNQFTTGSANGGTWFKLPGGLIVQFMTGIVVAASGNLVTLPTPFTSTSSYATVASNQGTQTVGTANSSASAVQIVYTGGGGTIINLIAVGS
jgi:hypothetical protein